MATTEVPPKARKWIEHLGLEPLPEEGGYFRRIFTHEGTLPDAGTFPGYACSSAIFFLITAAHFSALHRIRQEELFTFCAGHAAEMLQIDPSTGEATTLVLGNQHPGRETPWVHVPGRHWQGLRLPGEGQWALFSVTVSPAFAWSDFELADRKELETAFPAHQAKIRQFTRDP